jgi:two-component system response regulator AtoC
VLAQAVRLGPRDLPVLVTGETGTGKELVAALLHASGPRGKGPLVRFNAAALPETLAESELFGHEKGAFTGADRTRRGFFAEADGGTLVLDEVGELPLGVQGKLLRAVQEGEIQPVGRARPEKVDVRIVACTNRDLRAEVQAGRFREDLYYRLAVVELRVPPLRERLSDVPLLATAFCARFAERFGLEGSYLTPALLAALQAKSWPGNVRELEATVARICALSDGGPIDASALDAPEAPTTRGTYRERVDAFERSLLEDALAQSHGNQSEAARRLGMSRVTMIDRMRKLAIR